MFTSTITFSFREDAFESGCRIWHDEVFKKAAGRHGLVRIQFFASKPKAMAAGTWLDREYAMDFMETGVFKVFMEKAGKMMTSPPEQHTWELKFFAENPDN